MPLAVPEAEPEATAELALAVPLRQTFHYAVPPEALGLVRRGSIVVAPFGKRFVSGYVVATGGRPPAHVTELKPIREVLEAGEAISAELFELAQAVADYYLAPLGEVLRSALPSSAVRSQRRAALTEAGRLALEDLAPGLTPPDRALLTALARRGPLTVLAAATEAATGGAADRLRHLESDGLVTFESEVSRPARPVTERWLELHPEAPGPKDTARVALLGRSTVARKVLELLDGNAGPVLWERVRAETRALPAHLTKLEAQGLVRVVEVAVDRDLARVRAAAGKPDHPLTPAQFAAVGEVKRALEGGGFAPFLLHGVTGSGKTLVYLACIEEALRRGRSALVLVPEIALTAALARELRARFGDEVAMLHSALPPGERYDAWRRIQSGRARVAFGARSAVFAPLAGLGLVVVDEEHDASYKAGDQPHYHARDVAVLRAKLCGAAVVLGSATPSLESYANARDGRYTLLELAARPAGQALPAVEVVDMREEFERRGHNLVLSTRLEEEIGLRLKRGEQAMLLLNRRGYASFLVCRECGVRIECPNCSVCLTYHRKESRLKCHRCDHRTVAPSACASCQGSFLHLVGHGTEKVEACVRETFPAARIARLDADTARPSDHAAGILADFEKGQIDVLVGTQMVAKGHDFPRVTLVGVISVDAMLGLPDFRATERAFALLTQVAGRAGRGDAPGEVILQTYYPDNEAVKLACLQDYGGFYEREYRLRRLLRNPPTSALVNLIVHDPDRARVESEARALALKLRELARDFCRVVGPAMAPVERVKRSWRGQILIKSPSRKALRVLLDSAREPLTALAERGLLDIDVDPQDLL